MPDADAPKRRWTVSAIALFVIGLLILVPSGLCTAGYGAWLLVIFVQAVSRASGISALLFAILSIMAAFAFVLAIGGLFVGIGWSLVKSGLGRRKHE